MKNKIALSVFLLPAMFAPMWALAIEPVDRFSLSIGAYTIGHELDLRWDASEIDTGTHVNFHRDLGFDNSKREILWAVNGLLGEHHKLSAFGFGYDSSGERLLNADLEIGGETFPSEGAFAGKMEVKHVGLAYTWLFHHNERSAFGLGIGAIRYDVSADLAAAAAIGEGGISSIEQNFSESSWAPLLRLDYAHAVADHWRVGAELSYVKKAGGSTSGKAVDANIRIEYFPWQHFGFAIRYNYNDVELDFNSASFNADVDLRNRGPQLIATYRF